MSSPSQSVVQTQPRTYKVSIKSVLSLPFRICNPPPAVAKVRSCGVTPLFKVRLEDVLDRKHLPPLGLKDFEEWLLFVEMSPENLYFILWLREYKQRYSQWKSQAEFQSRNEPSDYPIHWSSQHSSHLAMFYARAKQTFFTPGSEYELNLTSSLLAPFHKPNMSPHPDPILFAEVELETFRTLEQSLRRFVNAQFNNVGNKRVLCGMIAGIIFALVLGILPLVLTCLRAESRWWRLIALPGLWAGLSIFYSSVNGICLGVYVFGDLRQLRKFELSRPPISKPKPLPPYRRWTSNARPLSTPNSILPIQQPKRAMVPNFYTGYHIPRRAPSISSVRVSEESLHTTSSDDHIHISPSYYDVDEVDAPAMYVPDSDYQFPEKQNTKGQNAAALAANATAGFIRPFDPISDDEDDLERSFSLPQRHQAMAPFDFDSLPSRPNFKGTSNKKLPLMQLQRLQIPTPTPPPTAVVSGPSGIIGRMQEKCNIARWRLQTGYLEPDTPSTIGGPGSPLPHSSSPYWSAHPNHSNANSASSGTTKLALPSESEKTTADTEEKVKKRFRMVQAVPAFAAPLTRVLSPVIVRGQWEIVVRSSLVALVFTCMVIGGLLAIPPVMKQ
ncbi:hypothetical protein CPB84DRAFT_1766188 [Gymnopilus junonius]|uniref:RGS domain-containing protein n=1 Tax=Gymnopilus junonius TaxID=109634 RepID=A0A9P5TT23_GYMJU|nr:hypothetical protein CPB84DRAFT_1766188 [Gymnopilus junonius]